MNPRPIPTAGLTTCVLGLAMTPYVYIAIGAMHAFDVMVSIITPDFEKVGAPRHIST
jgi:hypothetical protein